ncbi:hypothetical protein N9K21_06725 [Amylibacter sp.]|nr:hypothetical protein [Amylibacter sp.]
MIGYFIAFIYWLINSAIRGSKDEKIESQNFILVTLIMMTCVVLGGFLFGIDGVMYGILFSIPVGLRVNAWQKRTEALDTFYLLITVFTYIILPWISYSILGAGFIFIISIMFIAPISRVLNEIRFKSHD